MSRKHAALIGAALITTSLGASVALSQQTEAPPSAPSEKVCLQSNRMQNYDVVDDRTLVITDRFFKRYTVHMASGCVGLTPAAMNVVLQTRTSLGCFGQDGDKVAFNSPGLGRLSCFVTSVDNYVQPAPRQAN
jgi:Family of unknown function (DUF6491)